MAREEAGISFKLIRSRRKSLAILLQRDGTVVSKSADAHAGNLDSHVYPGEETMDHAAPGEAADAGRRRTTFFPVRQRRSCRPVENRQGIVLQSGLRFLRGSLA